RRTAAADSSAGLLSKRRTAASRCGRLTPSASTTTQMIHEAAAARGRPVSLSGQHRAQALAAELPDDRVVVLVGGADHRAHRRVQLLLVAGRPDDRVLERDVLALRVDPEGAEPGLAVDAEQEAHQLRRDRGALHDHRADVDDRLVVAVRADRDVDPGAAAGHEEAWPVVEALHRTALQLR